MQKSEDVVTHMQQNINDVQVLYPERFSLNDLQDLKAEEPFNPVVIEYLNQLSQLILKDKESRLYPDAVTFAFFCRKANILSLKEAYSYPGIRLGRGIIFHIAPSNVPINFAYSLVAGLLSGNINIVRVSTKYFPQVDLVIKHLANIGMNPDLQSAASKIVLVRYDRLSEATTYFSKYCNVRIIWGGDDTIAHIRKNPLPPRSFDVTFADRYSIAVINADKFVNESEVDKITTGFYNDTYLFDQNACSAPHLVVWLGNKKNIEESKIKFWKSLQKLVEQKYDFQSVLAVDKLTAFYRQAIHMDIKKTNNENNLLLRVNLDQLTNKIDKYRCAGGYFTEYTATSLSDIVAIVKNNYQTLAYYGLDVDEITGFVKDNRLKGIDRIVPIGQTTDFSLTWDGYNLIETLSRVCDVQ